MAPASLHNRPPQCALLDVRDEGAFLAGHLAGSGHIPLEALRVRRAELPPRTARLIVLGANAGAAAAAAAELEALGYPDVGWIDAPLALIENELRDRSPAARLWQPAEFLEQVLPRLPRGRALDLAAGAGREAVFLAMNGFEVEAWDHDRDVLARASELAARNGVTLSTVVRNLERRDPHIPAGRYDLVTVFRFLHRPLFPHIQRAIAPGGRLVYEAYRRGQERFGRPKHPRFLLMEGELAAAFPDLVVEHYEELSPPEGPVVARLLARRP